MIHRQDKMFSLASLPALLAAILFTACTQIQEPVTEPFFAATSPPPKQEFRWNNGKAPKSFDPARASAAPETDIVRALFEGLTELDPKSLEAIPAVAEKWSASEDNRIWTFDLRKDARWSNGRRVTASDFVTSWKRLATLEKKAAHPELFQNIVGLTPDKSAQPQESEDFLHSAAPEPVLPTADAPFEAPKAPENASQESDALSTTTGPKPPSKTIGVEAVDEFTFRVTLELPDGEFPKLAANPIFRPVFGPGDDFEKSPLDKNVITNGPFVVAESGTHGVVIERSDSYWNKSAVKLERIRFVPKETAEAALDAYKNGDLDAVTNANFEPLALKLLEPFDDFRRTTHSALNFYEFNVNNPPFDDRRVRAALATSVDRERLIQTELESAAQPANDFLPLREKDNSALSFDAKVARELLEKAGYPNGDGFPQIRLVINRNDIQQRVARSVTRMWKTHLNVDAQIIAIERNEIEAVRASGDFDVIRRGAVLPSVDELASLAAIFRSVVKKQDVQPDKIEGDLKPIHSDRLSSQYKNVEPADDSSTDPKRENPDALRQILTREDALYDVLAIPLYFPESYSLVKPYVYGFETNGLDAPSIKDIGINSAWQPPKLIQKN